MLKYTETYFVNQATVAVTECLKQSKVEHDLVWLMVAVHHSRKNVGSQSHQLMAANRPIKDKT